MVFHSSFESSYLWLPLVGFVVGFLASGLGAGGGLFYLLFLVLVFGITPQVAVSTALAATLPISLVGTIGHFRYGHIDLTTGILFALTGNLGAWLGTGVTQLLSPDQLKTAFGVYTILLAIQMLINSRKRDKIDSGETLYKTLDFKKIAKGTGYGFLGGVVAGSFGTGGAAPVLAGLFAMRLPVKLVIGTSLMVVLTNSIFGLAAHFVIGQIDLTLVYFLASGAVVGAVAGPRMLSRLKTDRSEGKMQLWYAIGLIVVGLIMILN